MTEQRLESWKAIAAHVSRGVRTVRRWEANEGLPVHRQMHKTHGTVYALASELDAWREGRRADASSRAAGPIPPRTAAGRTMIAVLPFDNLSGDAAHAHVADGLTEEMIGQLGRLNPDAVGVIARTTVMQFKGRGRTIRQIGVELDVAYVVEGSVRCEGGRVRVSAQLIQVRDQAQVWSGAYEQAVRAILALQREMAAAISREVRFRLNPRQPAARDGMDSVNPDAYYAHLKGRHFLNQFTPASVRRSLVHFRRAIEADPGFAPSYASLAETYERAGVWLNERPATALPLALDAARHALRLDPDCPEAHAAMGLIHANHLWDWAAAERHFQRALELNPSCAPARLWYAEFLAEMGRIDDALETIERAQVFDPLSPAVQATRAFVLLLGRRFDDAIAQAEQVLDLDPDYSMALIRLGVALIGKGRYTDAGRAFRRASRSSPELLDCLALTGFAYGIAGRTEDARKQLRELRRLARRRYVPAFLFAIVHLGLGDHDKAITLMEAECEARSWYPLLIRHGPQFDGVRAHPRFAALVRKMNFPPAHLPDGSR